MGYFFILLVFPVIYFVLLVSGYLSIVYNPWIRIGIIVSIALMYGLFSFRKKYTRRKNDYFENLSLQNGKIEDAEYFYTSHHDQKAKQTMVSIYIEGIFGHDFQLKFEGKIERFFKSIGLSPECQSGDTRFDETIYIVSDDSWLCTRLQNDSEIRTLLYDLFWCCHEREIKVDRLDCFDGRVMVTSRYRVDESDEAFVREYAKNVATLLQKIVIAIPSRGSVSDRMYREPSSYAAHIFNIVILALLANGVIVLFVDLMSVRPMPQLLDRFAIVPLSLAISLFILIMLMVAVFLALRNSSRFSTVSIRMLSIGLLGVIMTAIVEVKELDIRLDSSAENIYISQIVRKEAVQHRRRGTTYHLYVDSWNKRSSVFDLTVSHALFVQAQAGNTVRIHEHAGFLGYPWIETIEVTSQSDILLPSIDSSEEIKSTEEKATRPVNVNGRINAGETQVYSDRTFTQIKHLYGETFDEMSPDAKEYIVRNFKKIRQISQEVLDQTGWEIPQKIQITDSNVIEFYMHPDGTVSDVRFIRKSRLPILDGVTEHVVKLAHVKYPRPRTKTLIRLRVNYELGKNEASHP